MTATRSGIPGPVRMFVLKRDRGLCVRCGEPTRPGNYSLQHRVARGMGGSRHAARSCALILLCGSATTGCHGWVEANPATARQLGYRVPTGTDPATWPVRRSDGRTWLLTDDGWVRPSQEGPRP